MGRDVLLAAIIGAQGLKGEVKVKSFTSSPGGLRDYGVLHTKSGRTLKITAFRATKSGEAVIAFEGVTDRNAAEALRGEQLFVARTALPQTAQEEFYHADLIGLEARDGEGRVIGKIAGLHNYGASDVIEIARVGDDHLLMAFTRETVPVIQIAQGFVVVAVPDEDDEGTDHDVV